jgi:hypothetical protein
MSLFKLDTSKVPRLSPKVQAIMEYALEHGFELTSFGLEPNPFGFCYETHPDAENGEEPGLDEHQYFNSLLYALNESEELELRRAAL